MKKLRIVLILTALLFITGCQSKQPAEPAAGEEAQKKENLEAALGDYIIEPNDALMMVLSKSWDVVGTEDVYVLKQDGTGTFNGEPITYEGGFDEKNQIFVSITKGETEENYFVASDKSGYGLELTPQKGGNILSLFPTGYSLLEISDEKVQGLVGSWKDDNDNGYVISEDSTLLFKETETLGNWYAIDKEGVLCFVITVEGGSLEFEYELQEEGQTIALYDRAGEVWHYWRKS